MNVSGYDTTTTTLPCDVAILLRFPFAFLKPLLFGTVDNGPDILQEDELGELEQLRHYEGKIIYSKVTSLNM